MKHVSATRSIALGAALAATALAGETLPVGWTAPLPGGDYAAFLDRKVRRSGQGSGSVKCLTASPGGDGTLMQTVAVGIFRGKRIRMSGYLKTLDAASAQLWVQADGPDRTLTFDHMDKRPITGTTDWVKCELVIDVPLEAINLKFGACLRGTGQLWVDDLRFELAGQAVGATEATGEWTKATKEADKSDTEPRAPVNKPAKNAQPRNLGFEEGGDS